MENLSYGFGLLVAITIGYAIVSFDLWRSGNSPLAIVFGGYAFANIGLLWSMK